VNLFNPDRIVLAGWAGLALGARLLPQIRAAAAERALRHPFGQTTIQLGQLGPDAVALGAAALPVADLLARGASMAAPGGRRPPVRLHAPA
jgi:predicted NBD/HSP70 family sugar kinase